MAVDELAPYLVENFQEIDKTRDRGSGSFGSVYYVAVSGFPCIAKRLHDILVGQNVGEEERRCIRRRFRDECVLLSSLRHPNVVQFIGVHYGETRDELTLVMERLYTDLEKCLSAHRTIPLPIQLSILLDVAYGLLYLHSRTPVIIHRDLKASNVLLTSDMRAKLADLGVSKILDVHPLSEVIRTTCPGTPGVMPPEALVQKPVYTSKLDDFSFGILVLHVVNHEFPVLFETDEFKKGEMHIAKRSYALNLMGQSHCLRSLVIQCLQDNPEKRPTTNDICSALESLSNQHDRKFKDVLDLYEALSASETALREANMESREAEMQAVIRTRERELRCALEEALSARQEVEAKTAQVKEYKAQVMERESHNKVLSREMDKVRSALEKETRQRPEKPNRAHLRLKSSDSAPGELGVNQFEVTQMELETLRKQAASSSKLQDDVLVKTQQMKQYKKQVDAYKAHMVEQKAEMDGLKAELGAYQERTMQQKQQKKDLPDSLLEESDGYNPVQAHVQDPSYYKTGEVMQSFAEVCVAAVSSVVAKEDTASVITHLHQDAGEFLNRCANGTQDPETLRRDLLSGNPSPFKFFIDNSLLTADNFQIQAFARYGNHASKFCDELMQTFRQLPGGQSLPNDNFFHESPPILPVHSVLMRIFSGQLGIGCQVTSSLSGRDSLPHELWPWWDSGYRSLTRQSQQSSMPQSASESEECPDRYTPSIPQLGAQSTAAPTISPVPTLHNQTKHSKNQEAKKQNTMDHSGCLRGVDKIIDEIEFVLTDEARSYEWVDGGFKLHTPHGALPAGAVPCRINVKASLSGQFEFPENSELVSPVHWVSTPKNLRFSKLLTIHVQHCGTVENRDDSDLSFVVAKCTQPDLPYKFKFLDGGLFVPNSSYGSISVTHFSGLGIVSKLRRGQSYCAHTYVSNRGRNEWRVHFVILRDLDIVLKAVDTHYSFARRDVATRIVFEENEISLDIPREGQLTSEGWKILPPAHPSISKRDADRFRSGGRGWIPACELMVWWERSGQHPVRFQHEVSLIGAKAPQNYFYIVINPESEGIVAAHPDLPNPDICVRYPAGLEDRPQLCDLMNEIAAKIPSKWRQFGIELRLPHNELDGFLAASPGDVLRCFSSVFTVWKDRMSREPYSWLTVVESLMAPAVGEHRLALELNNKLIRTSPHSERS